MNDWLSYNIFIYAIGFLAQLLFSARLILQWYQSEKKQRVVTSVLFWKFSLIASFLLFIYGWLRDDFAIILGQSITYFIYIRNMQLQKSWYQISKPLRLFLFVIPVLIIIYAFNNNIYDIDRLFRNQAIPAGLIVWGSLAQLIFTSRFVYQWWYSEKRKTSTLPSGFWMMSLIGSLMILSYAVLRKDPVLFIGQIFGFTIYFRNIILGFKSQKTA